MGYSSEYQIDESNEHHIVTENEEVRGALRPELMIFSHKGTALGLY